MFRLAVRVWLREGVSSFLAVGVVVVLGVGLMMPSTGEPVVGGARRGTVRAASA